ncbi:MAG: nucleoside phosphorylase [Bacteroidaceae bacterium]|jgi:uridine phosphorylase
MSPERFFPPSELILNDDGSVFHLHLRPEQLAGRVILVGDPGRVATVAAHFDEQYCEVANREFHAITGRYGEKEITVLSTGIGCDNIDIVLNELDALANIDFTTRREYTRPKKQLTIVRIGTCGGLQPDTPIGTFICSVKSIGFDGLLNFYAGRDQVCDLKTEKEFTTHVQWNPHFCAPYVAQADETLVKRLNSQGDLHEGITISCPGFYGPQGRELRIPLAEPELNQRIESFRSSSGLRILNFEMESSAVAGLSALLGHKAATVCIVIANRRAKEANANYRNSIDQLIKLVLERI